MPVEKPSFYTKRMAKRWQNIEEFNFPALLARFKGLVEEPYDPEEYDDEIPF